MTTQKDIVDSIKNWYTKLDPTYKTVVKGAVIGGGVGALLPIITLPFGAIVGGVAGTKVGKDAFKKAVDWIKKQK